MAKQKENPKTFSQLRFDRAIRNIENGNYVKPSVIAAGINFNTFKSWMQKGKKSDDPDNFYKQLYDRVEQAKATAEVNYVEVVNDNAQSNNLGAAQWWLSRSKPKRWAATQRIEEKSEVRQKIEIVPYKPPEDND